MDSADAIREAIHRLLAGENLDAATVDSVFNRILGEQLDHGLVAALLTAWRAKGESPEELAAGANYLRRRMTIFDTGGREVFDTCGVGGDGARTFNISTAVALVLAAAGVAVVKHGNRAVSSNSGSSDVLLALGLPAIGDVNWPRRTFDRLGIAFCHAPDYHPALGRLGPLRRTLGFRTIFNCLGPLLNPARPQRQLIGVANEYLVEVLADAVMRLGTTKTLVVSGPGGLDEIHPGEVSFGEQVADGIKSRHAFDPVALGLTPGRVDELCVRDATESAEVIRGVLAGQGGAARTVVLMNAAAALVCADAAETLADGVETAIRTIDSGRAGQLLEELARV